MAKLVIWMRTKLVINTDPQRRCYNGCHAKSEICWSSWNVLEYTTEVRSEQRLKFWRELNDYAISQRGSSAKSEFVVLQENEVPNESS